MEEPKRGRGRPKKQTYESLREERKALYHPKKVSGGWMVGKKKLPPCNLYTALLFAFKHAENPKALEFLFWEIADILWNSDPDERKFIKHKWSTRLIRAACNEKYLGVGGSASAGKSYVFAGWGIVCWLADPANTLILLTSTDLKGARRRIWGAVRKLLAMVPDPPCKIKDSTGVIAYYNGHEAFDTAGLQLVTADKSKSADAVGRLVGTKSPVLKIIADELGEMGPNVISAATGNLAKNESFQCIGLSNPASRFDPFGLFCEPRLGWGSVDVFRDTEWRTKLNGLYLRLDSEESPNIDNSPSEEWPSYDYCPGVVTQEHIDDDLNIPGTTPEEIRKTRNYLRFHRAVFFDSDEAETVYAETELVRAGALGKITINNPTKIAGFDPSYSDGGDKSVIVFAEEGFDQYSQHCIQVTEILYLTEDMQDKENPRTLQMAEKVKAACIKRGVLPENLGIDASSGAGTGICDMLRLQWGTDAFLRVQFGGSASDRKIKSDSHVTAKQRYKNRASELFFLGKAYLLGKQLFGIPPIIAKQICQRICLEPTKGEKGLIFQVEPKKIFRARTGYSPDEADAFFVCVETARVRRLFVANDPVPQRAHENIAAWLGSRRTNASFSADRMGYIGNL